MKQLLSEAILFVSEHGAWAGPIVGLLSFGESLAIVGLLIPATAAMLTIGGLIGVGVLDPAPILLWAVAGAILGDWISYWAGLRIGPSVYRRWPLNRHRTSVARARLLFRRYGFAAVFIGRLLGPIRATIPLVAGVMKMPKRPFQIANLASAMLWVPSLLIPGAVAGSSVTPAAGLDDWQLIALGGLIILMTVGALAIASRILGSDRERQRRKARKRAGTLTNNCNG